MCVCVCVCMCVCVRACVCVCVCGMFTTCKVCFVGKIKIISCVQSCEYINMLNTFSTAHATLNH